MKNWKSVLESLAIVAYVPVTAYLCYTMAVAGTLAVFGHPLTDVSPFSWWAGLLAAGALVLFLRGRKAAGWIMAAAAFIAAMISYVLLKGILFGGLY